MNVTLNVTVTTPEAAIALINALNGNKQAPTASAAPRPAPFRALRRAGRLCAARIRAAPTPPPTTHVAETYTIDQLRTAAMQLVDAGRQAEVRDLISSYGVQLLTDIPQDRYPAFMASLRSMGARI